MNNFSQLLENILRWVFPPWDGQDGEGRAMSWERYVSRILPPAQPTTSSQKQFQKFNIQEKREKKFNLISPPLRKVVQEKMAEELPGNYSKSHLPHHKVG